jgi:hypothetical protein
MPTEVFAAMTSQASETALAPSDHSHQPGDVAGESHGKDDHGETHGHDDHGHAPEVLGPVDTERWGAFAGGILLGLVVALMLVFTTNVAG